MCKHSERHQDALTLHTNNTKEETPCGTYNGTRTTSQNPPICCNNTRGQGRCFSYPEIVSVESNRKNKMDPTILSHQTRKKEV